MIAPFPGMGRQAARRTEQDQLFPRQMPHTVQTEYFGIRSRAAKPAQGKW